MVTFIIVVVIGSQVYAAGATPNCVKSEPCDAAVAAYHADYHGDHHAGRFYYPPYQHHHHQQQQQQNVVVNNASASTYAINSSQQALLNPIQVRVWF